MAVERLGGAKMRAAKGAAKMSVMSFLRRATLAALPRRTRAARADGGKLGPGADRTWKSARLAAPAAGW